MRGTGWGNVSDEDLLRQLKGGAAGALAILFDRHYRQVFSLAHCILRNSAQAAQFDPASGNVKDWILQYASQRSLNRWRDLRLRGRSVARAAACGDGSITA